MELLRLIDELEDVVQNAKAFPLSDQLRVEREAIYDVVDEIRVAVPDELKQARWIVKERQEMLAEARRECERLLHEARREAAQETSREAVGRRAEREAQELLGQARREASRIRAESEDWADEILANLELNLDKFMGAVRRGRERLHERSSKEAALEQAA
jgi:hypothetical protein